MKRDIDLEKISDGRLYGLNDMVRADCGGCKGCYECCRGMGSSVVLDPLDLYRLTRACGLSFPQLLDIKIELNVQDGLILPNLKMTGAEEKCAFLDASGRCEIHAFRPGLCRLFPLGRLYEEGSFRYFLQVHECQNTGRTKVKVRKWLDTAGLTSYESFVTDWHYFILDQQERCAGLKNEELVKKLNLYVLEQFYAGAYEGEREEEFYPQFYERLLRAREFTAAFA